MEGRVGGGVTDLSATQRTCSAGSLILCFISARRLIQPRPQSRCSIARQSKINYNYIIFPSPAPSRPAYRASRRHATPAASQHETLGGAWGPASSKLPSLSNLLCVESHVYNNCAMKFAAAFLVLCLAILLTSVAQGKVQRTAHIQCLPSNSARANPVMYTWCDGTRRL